MQAYRTHIVIKNPHRVTLSNLPFRPGQHVEVLFLAHEESRVISRQELEILFKDTQSLPNIQPLTEDEIAAEVAVYRAGQ
jgi:hypothetical protein